MGDDLLKKVLSMFLELAATGKVRHENFGYAVPCFKKHVDSIQSLRISWCSVLGFEWLFRSLETTITIIIMKIGPNKAYNQILDRITVGASEKLINADCG